MDWVVSGVFLILESGLRNDGKAKAKAGGESSGAKMRTSLTRTSLPTLSASAGAGIQGATPKSQRGGEEPRRAWLRTLGGACRLSRDAEGEGGAQPQRQSLGNTCQFPGNWKRLGRFFSSSWLCTVDSVSL